MTPDDKQPLPLPPPEPDWTPEEEEAFNELAKQKDEK